MTIQQFLDYLCLERNYSPLTVKSYGDDLRRFEAFFTSMDSGLTWETVDSDVIRDWMEHMMDSGNSASSVCRRLSALRSFYRYALMTGFVSHDPAHGIDGPRKSKPLPKYVREDDMRRLLDDYPWSDTYKDVRARTILLVFYETGVRVSELVSLDDSDVDMSLSQIKVTGKRNKQRIVPFGNELAAALDHCAEVRDKTVPRLTSAFFASDKGLRMTAGQVRYIVKSRLSLVTTQPKRSPHVLRHTFATAMLNHDAGIESVQKLLGHASLSTTEIYTHTTFEQLKRAYKKSHPRS